MNSKKFECQLCDGSGDMEYYHPSDAGRENPVEFRICDRCNGSGEDTRHHKLIKSMECLDGNFALNVFRNRDKWFAATQGEEANECLEFIMKQLGANTDGRLDLALQVAFTVGWEWGHGEGLDHGYGCGYAEGSMDKKENSIDE